MKQSDFKMQEHIIEDEDYNMRAVITQTTKGYNAISISFAGASITFTNEGRTDHKDLFERFKAIVNAIELL